MMSWIFVDKTNGYILVVLLKLKTQGTSLTNKDHDTTIPSPISSKFC